MKFFVSLCVLIVLLAGSVLIYRVSQGLPIFHQARITTPEPMDQIQYEPIPVATSTNSVASSTATSSATSTATTTHR